MDYGCIRSSGPEEKEQGYFEYKEVVGLTDSDSTAMVVTGKLLLFLLFAVNKLN